MITIPHSSQGRLVTILLGSLLAISLLTTAIFFVMKEDEKKEKVRIQQELDSVNASHKQLEGDIHEFQLSEAALNEKANLQEQSIISLTKELQEQTALRQVAEQNIIAKEGELRDLRKQLLKIEAEKRELEATLQKQYEEYFEMKTQLGALLKTKEELELRAKELAENGPVSLGTVVVRQSHS